MNSLSNQSKNTHKHSLNTNTKSSSQSDNYVANASYFKMKVTHISYLDIRYLLPAKRSPDILGMCKTFLHENIKNDTLKISNYSFERKDGKYKIIIIMNINFIY